jgi:uncharacterized membrane protein YphA (DoxX/SURF4 family)
MTENTPPAAPAPTPAAPKPAGSAPTGSAPAGSAPAGSKLFWRYLPIIVRILMGLLFLVSGLNYFFHLFDQPKDPLPEQAMAYADALAKTGYMMPLVMGTQLLAGVLLVTGLFVPLALVLIAPIIVGIVTFHAYLAPKGMPIAVGVVLLELFLLWAYRGAFRPMLAIRAKPGP